MRYIELIADRPLIWGLFLAYMAVTAGLAWIGHRKTKDIKSFAIGSGTMNPIVVGVTLAASIASAATFVINPGFVYVHGVSALLHFGVAAGSGIIAGLLVMSFGFRAIGARHNALTLPHWVGQRFGSRSLSVLFAGVNLLSLSFVVLIVGGLSIVMQNTLGLSNLEALILIIAFVFGYVFIGGTWAHAYTNTLQGFIMVAITLVILASGVHLFADGLGAFAGKIAHQDPVLVLATNPRSTLFGNGFSVYVCGFVIGFALMCQPHILTKALYVKDGRAVGQYLGVTIAIALVFTALLLVGLYARAMAMPPEAFVDPETGVFRQDLVMTVYLAKTFSPAMLAVITVAILAAGMSTLDGILVALSAITANDLFLPIAGRHWSEQRRARAAHRASQIILVAMGIGAFLLSLRPPELLGIFGQIGVYGIAAASTVPILFGILFPRTGRAMAWSAAVTGLAVHFGLYGLGVWARARGLELGGQLANPAVTATCALLASMVVASPMVAVSLGIARPRRPRAVASATPLAERG